MWTQEWSVIPSRRAALTAETCHQALTWLSALTASSSRSSRRLPRVGARTRTSAIASRGGDRLESKRPERRGLADAGAARGVDSPGDRLACGGDFGSRGASQQYALAHPAVGRPRPRAAEQLERPPRGSAARPAAAARGRRRARTGARSRPRGSPASSAERPLETRRASSTRTGQPAQRRRAAADRHPPRAGRRRSRRAPRATRARARGQLRRRRADRSAGTRPRASPEPSSNERQPADLIRHRPDDQLR